MRPQLDKLSGQSHRWARVGERVAGADFVVFCGQRRQETLEFGRVETSQGDVQVGNSGQLFQEVGQLVLVPIATDLVERQVERFFLVVREIYDHGGDFFRSLGHQDLEALVPSNQVSG